MTKPEVNATIFVTGGASGIGFAMPHHFTAQGYRITALDVNANEGPAIVAALERSILDAPCCSRTAMYQSRTMKPPL